MRGKALQGNTKAIAKEGAVLVAMLAMGGMLASPVQASSSCYVNAEFPMAHTYNVPYPYYPCPEESTYQTVSNQIQNQQTVDFLSVISGTLGHALSGAPRNSIAGNAASKDGLAAGGGDSRWTVWGAVNHSALGYTFEPMRSSGYGNVLLGGVDYTFSGNIILGMALTVEQTRVNTGFNNGRVSGDGYSYAPYVAIPLGSNWAVDASVGFGKSNIDNKVAGVTDSVDVDRFFRAVSLSYFRDVGRWQFTGKGSYLASEDHFNATATTASNRYRLEQLRLGGQVAYDMGSWQPFAGLYHINDIGSSRVGAVGLQTPDNDRNAWQIQLGVNVLGRGPLSGGVTLFSEVGRSQTRNDSILANINYRF